MFGNEIFPPFLWSRYLPDTDSNVGHYDKVVEFVSEPGYELNYNTNLIENSNFGRGTCSHANNLFPFNAPLISPIMDPSIYIYKLSIHSAILNISLLILRAIHFQQIYTNHYSASQINTSEFYIVLVSFILLLAQK